MNLPTVIIIIALFIMAYVIIIEIFTLLFRTTGLNKDKARYQTISLFTNCGFTTSESELITSNRRRKRIATVLMIIGHAFSVIIVSLLVAMISSMNQETLKNSYLTIIIVLGALTLLLLLFKLPFIAKPIRRSIDKFTMTKALKQHKDNIITVLDNYGSESLAEIYLYFVPDILQDKSLLEVNLKRNYNLNLVTVKRGNKVLEVSASTIIQPLDEIIVFGNIDIIKDIFSKKERRVIEKSNKNKVAIIDNYGSDALCEIKLERVPEILDNIPLGKSVLKSNYDIQILMIGHDDTHNLTNKDSVIKKGDTILVFGPYQNIKDIFRIEIENVSE